jgi:hypothetical protein
MNRKTIKAVLGHLDWLFLIILQIVLLRWLASREVVSVLAGGGAIPRVEAFAMVFFVLLRIVTYFLVPGLILSRAVLLAVHLAKKRSGQSNAGF